MANFAAHVVGQSEEGGRYRGTQHLGPTEVGKAS